ncbi:MAG: hypothetical protein QNJ70_06245 [Xenococcaceae cyanobacterium MO_207.B15]|nr:hypothetical protein [Xenococcaceae cyanobacterium MO_207.B15]MDJ0743629.1 hypothetical protein [Xenococcaceae cyanobacterium MO_167.B27]
MKVLRTIAAIALSMLTLEVHRTHAAVLIAPTDLDALELGPAIIGPLGPEVPGTFVTNDAVEIGNLRSSVFCPIGTEQADCPSDSVETYIYRHIVTPSLNDITSFTAGFPVAGFTGVAGYSFSESGLAGGNGSDTDFNIVFNDDTDETLVWGLSNDSDLFFDSGETITFFWQSIIPPAGPIGSYSLSNSEDGTAIGPAPVAPTAPAPVPEPSTLVFLALSVFFLWLIRPSSPNKNSQSPHNKYPDFYKS